MTDKIKIVKYGGRLNPIYEEIGEIELMKITIRSFSENEEDEEFCIDINDLMDWVNRK
ncbi:MAG: hypothetical protein PHD03_04815 [Bacilli bacterium]|nr:hypothetical protein [Bacilli bacterium]